MTVKPKYSVGTRVYHISKKKWGTVVLAFESGNEWRYYVDHSRWRWSIPEQRLDS